MKHTEKASQKNNVSQASRNKQKHFQKCHIRIFDVDSAADPQFRFDQDYYRGSGRKGIRNLYARFGFRRLFVQFQPRTRNYKIHRRIPHQRSKRENTRRDFGDVLFECHNRFVKCSGDLPARRWLVTDAFEIEPQYWEKNDNCFLYRFGDYIFFRCSRRFSTPFYRDYSDLTFTQKFSISEHLF